MLKKRNERKKEKKNEKKKRKKIQLKKYNLNIIKEIQQKKGEAKKGVGERGGGAHRKNICPKFLPESFSFLFMKLLRNVYQIKTMCRIQLWLLFLYLFRVMALWLSFYAYFVSTVILSTNK